MVKSEKVIVKSEKVILKSEEVRGFSPLRFHFNNLIKEHAVSAAGSVTVEQEFLIRAA